MAEYIERAAALALLKDDREVCADSKEELKYIRADIRSIPAADVVARDCYDRLLAENDELRKMRPVVLCRDCKHYRLDPIKVRQMVCIKDADEVDGYFSGFLSYPSEDWFCADGIKKEES